MMGVLRSHVRHSLAGQAFECLARQPVEPLRPNLVQSQVDRPRNSACVNA
jgi:hypothetical protein